jgi:hypothetical protein
VLSVLVDEDFIPDTRLVVQEKTSFTINNLSLAPGCHQLATWRRLAGFSPVAAEPPQGDPPGDMTPGKGC